MSLYLPGKEYRILNTRWNFGFGIFTDWETVDYNPTGKYRIYEDGKIIVEFTAQFELKRWLRKNEYQEITEFIHESEIVFKKKYKEYNCNED